jgi:hypothetical protein
LRFTVFVDFASIRFILMNKIGYDLSNHAIHEPGVNGIDDPFANRRYNVKVIRSRWVQAALRSLMK